MSTGRKRFIRDTLTLIVAAAVLCFAMIVLWGRPAKASDESEAIDRQTYQQAMDADTEQRARWWAEGESDRERR